MGTVRFGIVAAPTAWRLLTVAALLAAQIVVSDTRPARAQGIEPRTIATTDGEAGREAARAIDKDGGDERSIWVQLRWERSQEKSSDFNTGPATIENTIWVAKDLSSARAIYEEQSKKNVDFPEAFYAHKGPYSLGLPKLGDDISGMSPCRDCNAKDEIFLHHRVSFRRGVVVGTLYLYGSDTTAPQDLVSWYVSQVVTRIPDAAAQAPERVGGEPAVSASEPAGEAGQGQPGGPAASTALVTANPKDLIVKLDEAGKGAKLKSSKDGKDERGIWYEARYEREGTGSRFFQGPVTMYSLVIMATDVEGAKKTYQEQVAQNEKLPEADRRIGQKFELKEANEVGEEGAGRSACERTCNDGGEIYVHKRLVTRVANVVRVVYIWGLSNPDGTTDWHARYFGGLVADRIRAARG